MYLLITKTIILTYFLIYIVRITKIIFLTKKENNNKINIII